MGRQEVRFLSGHSGSIKNEAEDFGCRTKKKAYICKRKAQNKKQSKRLSMKRILSSIMFSALLMCPTMGQIKSHSWQMGPLTWNDFQHKTTLNGHRSFLEYYMGIEPSRKKIDGVLYVRPSAYAFVSPEYSWADTAQRTPALLRYNQAAFGLMEVYRRRLERRLSTADLFVDEQQVLDNTMRQLNEDIDRLESETAQGDDSSALGQWERDIALQLDSLHPLDIYSHTDAPFRWVWPSAAASAEWAATCTATSATEWDWAFTLTWG
jgi:hypothetical protein